jgi:hypothetical protein
MPGRPAGIPVDPPPPPVRRRLRRRLEVGSATDSLEWEADQAADRAMNQSAPWHPAALSGRRLPMLPQIPLREHLPSPGRPLGDGIRALMEPRIGRDLSAVRIHTDDDAADWANDINARAFTAGSHVFFDKGQYDPSSPRGRRLLAHELAHVAQQAEGRGTGTVQRQPREQDKDAIGQQALLVPFRLQVTRTMSPEEVLEEFIRQYYGVTSDADVAKIRRRWFVQPHAAVSEADVRAGYKALVIQQTSGEFLGKLSKDEQKAVNDETDKRFWDSNKDTAHRKLTNSPQDRKMAKKWLETREAVLLEESQRKRIEALPKDIKDALFAGDANAPATSAADYDQVLQIAEKLMQLTPAQRADYLARVNADTTSLTDMEASVDRYIESTKKREEQDKAADETARPLLGLETLHEEWKAWKHDVEHPLKMEGRGGGYGPLLDERQKHADTYFDDLQRLKFANNQAFEDAMEQYRIAFRDQTVRFALDQLALFEHMLFAEKKKLEKQGGADQIAKGLADQHAAEHFHHADMMASYGMTSHGNSPDPNDKVAKLTETPVDKENEAGRKAVLEGSKDDFVAQRDIDLKKLATSDAAGVKKYLLDEIEKRYQSLSETRKEFAEDPERVFSLMPLLEASREHFEIGKDSIYWMVVQDEVTAKKNRKIFSSIAIGIIAIALTLLVPVGGAIAAGAMVANAGLSVYQAYEAYEEYKKGSNDYTLGFLDDKPSFGWVVLAVAAAAIDVGLPVAEVFANSASGLRKAESALRTFNEEKDATKLSARLKAIDDLRPEVARALEARARAIEEEAAAWKEARATSLAVLPGVSGYIAGVALKYGKPLFKTIRRGITSFVALSKDAEFVAAMGDITKMSGAEREAIETAFTEMKDVVAAGEKASMDEKTLETFVDRWVAGRGQGGNFQQKLLDEMKVWRPLTGEQKEILSRLGKQKALVEQRYGEKASLLEERSELLAKATRTAEDKARLRETAEELNKLDPLWNKGNLSERELAQARAQLRKEGKGLGSIHADEVTLEGVEKEAKSASLSLYDRLRAAAPSNAAKDRALRGVTADQVGALKGKPTGLQVDHIVSVDEVSEMEGFKELTWEQQKRVVDMRENLIVMDASANASKSNRSWRSWPQWANYYADEATKTKMIANEDLARTAIEQEIARLRGVPVNP